MTAVVIDFISERVRRGTTPKITMVDAARRFPGTVHKFMVNHQPLKKNDVDHFLLELEVAYRRDWF